MNRNCLKITTPLAFVILFSGCVGAPIGYGVQANSMKEWQQQQNEQAKKREKEFYKNTMSELNSRERIYKSIFKESSLESINYESVDYNSLIEEPTNSFSEYSKNESIVKYRRSSLYTLMIADTLNEEYYRTKYVFGNSRLSDKFNNHNIGPYQIIGKAGDSNQAQNIENYLNKNQVAKQLIAKWFNRGKDGSFNMNLVARRGEYNASELDIKIALHTVRGKAMLKDAGEELIGNTFVVVYDFENNENNRNIAPFKYSLNSEITIRAYLYRLVWDDYTATVFYNDYWLDKNSLESSRKTAFENSDIFKLKYIGNVVIDEHSNTGIVKHNREVLKKFEKETIDWNDINSNQTDAALKNALNVCLNELERKYEEFWTKFPLYSGNPIAAKVGKKEGLKEGDTFEVLEQILNKDGTTEYQRKGVIKIKKEKDIWNNTAEGDWFGDSSEMEYTIFQGQKGKYHQGMLIRQIN